MGEITYIIDYPTEVWQCRVAIYPLFKLENKTVTDYMKSMILFWTDGESNLELNNGDVTKTFLQMLGKKVMSIQVEKNLNTAGVVAEFNSMEGWYPLDGRCGIKIVDVDKMEYNEREFEILEA